MGRLDDKVAVITGAASGQGYATALSMLREGARVIGVDVNVAGLSDLRSESDDEIVTRRCDVSSLPDVQAAVDEALSLYGRLDIMCNCAAVVLPATIGETSEEDWQKTIAVNLQGVFYGCKTAINAMRKTGGGSIINWGSNNSVVAEPQVGAYCASKGGVLMLTKSAAIDHAREGVRVNCLCPGAIDTPLNGPFYEAVGGRAAYEELLKERQPLGMGTPQQVADVAVFLASDESSLITGTAILVDGGFTAG